MSVTPEFPDHQQLLLPLLRLAAVAETTIPQAAKRLARHFALTREQRAQTVRGGRYPLIHHRVHRAERMLADARLTERPQRGVFRATARGRDLLAARPDRIDDALLVGWASRHSSAPSLAAVAARPPYKELPATDRLAAAAEELDAALRHELLDRILGVPDMPRRAAFFEDLVVDVLTAMGYGGRRHDAAIRLGGNNDGGVDAVILLDPLGLDRLYVQAKCYSGDNLVDVRDVREFAGILEDKKPARGALLTTSRFTRGAKDFVRGIRRPIALIDGAELTRLMVEHGVGIRKGRTVTMKEVDEDYFAA